MKIHEIKGLGAEKGSLLPEGFLQNCMNKKQGNCDTLKPYLHTLCGANSLFVNSLIPFIGTFNQFRQCTT